MDRAFEHRVGALDAVWARWAEIGAGLAEPEWSAASRCLGWDVAALYAHVGMFPGAVAEPPPVPDGAGAEVVTAVDILRGFNAPGGVADDVAGQVAQAAVSTAGALERSALVALYVGDGPRAVAAVRTREPTSLVPWPGPAP